MQTQVIRHKQALQPKRLSSSNEVRFLAELGRKLMPLVHPAKVARCVAEELKKQVPSSSNGVIVELGSVGVINYAFDRNGTEKAELVHRNNFRRWLSILPPQISTLAADAGDFLLAGASHRYEYVSPLIINGSVCGAIVTGFEKRTDCTDAAKGVIDAAAQMAAMSINLCAHFQNAMDESLNKAKEEHRKFTEVVLNALPVSLYVIDRNYRIVTWNQHREAGKQGILRDEVIGRTVFEVLSKKSKQKLEQEFERVFETGKIERIEQRTTDDGGTTRHWVVSKVPIIDRPTGEVTHVIVVGEDVTFRVETLQAGARAEKLAAVGRLAAGVVHEINNPLATISACAEALERRVSEGAFDNSPDAEDLREYLGLIRNETFRCKGITTGLLDFSRVRTGNRMPVDISETVRSSARLVTHQIGKKPIEIKLDLAEKLPLVNADEGQLQQALLALATNAVDAMSSGGTLTFRCYAEKNKVQIEITDTGVGIPVENMAKIFEPFFTTKDIGQGTGLGLAVCYGIISDHSGRLTVRSNPGLGTTFTVSLPSHKN